MKLLIYACAILSQAVATTICSTIYYSFIFILFSWRLSAVRPLTYTHTRAESQTTAHTID